MARARATVEDSAEQRKKDARRRARTEKSRLAKVSPKKGGTASPKPYKKPSKEAIAKGQKEIESTSPAQLHDDWTITELVKGRDTRAEWDVGRGGKRGQLRGTDIPMRTADQSERESRRNPARGAHRGQSVGSRWDYDYKQGGNVSEAEAFFTEQTTPKFVNTNKWVPETATPDAKIVKKIGKPMPKMKKKK